MSGGGLSWLSEQSRMWQLWYVTFCVNLPVSLGSQALEYASLGHLACEIDKLLTLCGWLGHSQSVEALRGVDRGHSCLPPPTTSSPATPGAGAGIPTIFSSLCIRMEAPVLPRLPVCYLLMEKLLFFSWRDSKKYQFPPGRTSTDQTN